MKWARKFLVHWENRLGLFLILLFLAGAILAPVISPQDPKEPGPFKQVGRTTDLYPHPPSEDAILGTLPGQYDVFHTLIWGMRGAMVFGLLVAIGSFLSGVFFGSIAGYAGGFINSLMMRIADAFLTFPIIAGVVFVQQLIGLTVNAMGGTFYFNVGTLGKVIYFNSEPTPLMNFLINKLDPVMIVLILFSWVPYARLVNSIVLTLKQTEYIQAARALGGNSLWVIRRHLIPNSIGPALVLGARDVGSAVILQATITFIGLGGTSAWGTLLSMGRNFVLGAGGSLLTHWWVYLPVTLSVILFGVAWNLVGDGLNDILATGSHRKLPVETAAKGLEKEQIRPATGMKPVLSVSSSSSPTRSTIPQQKQPVSNDGIDPILCEARKNVLNDDMPRALHCYHHLIQRGRSIDLILPDLANMVKQYPRDPQIWQTLGNVLTRIGDVPHANQCYERAERLRL